MYKNKLLGMLNSNHSKYITILRRSKAAVATYGLPGNLISCFYDQFYGGVL